MKTLRYYFALMLVWFLSGIPTLAATVHYVSQRAGSDSNDGLTPATAWKTIAAVNAYIAAGCAVGDQILFERNNASFPNVWREILTIGTNYQNTGANTVTTNPPPCQGALGNPVVFGSYGVGMSPFIDAADPIPFGTWTAYDANGTYTTTLPAGTPFYTKFFTDVKFDDSVQNMQKYQLLLVPNYLGLCSSLTSTSFNFLDSCSTTSTSGLQVYTQPAPFTGTGSSDFRTVPYCSPTTIEGRQCFDTASTGIQNVQAGVSGLTPPLKGYGYPNYPGAVWFTGSVATGFTYYVHLADNSSPAAHTFEGTTRDYGVVIKGTNYITVSNFAVMHAAEECIVGYPFSDTDAVGNYYWIESVSVGNCGGLGIDRHTAQHTVSGNGWQDHGGIVIKTSGQALPSILIDHPRVSNSTIGTTDGWHDVDDQHAGGVIINGFTAKDNSGGSDSPVLMADYISTTASPGALLGPPSTTQQSIGGRVAYSTFTNNQENLGFGGIAGGRIDHNRIFKSFGEGIQLGGFSTSYDSGSDVPGPGTFVLEDNVIENIGKNAHRSLYNGVDCNSASSLFNHWVFRFNRIRNVWGAPASFEGTSPYGCADPYAYGNIFDQHATSFGNQSAVLSYVNQGDGGMNGGNLLYMTVASGSTSFLHTSTWHFHDNAYIFGSGTAYVGPSSGSTPTWTWTQWQADGEDVNSIGTGTALGFVNEGTDFRLTNTSPLRSITGLGGMDIGPEPYVDPTTYLRNVINTGAH